MRSRMRNSVSFHILEETPSEPINPCQPSPCGPFSQCQNHNGSPSCTCMIEYFGSPPNCRPECISNSDCSSKFACISHKCKDPCTGVCGLNSQCHVVSHTPNCACLPGYIGDPFIQCVLPPGKLKWLLLKDVLFQLYICEIIDIMYQAATQKYCKHKHLL